MSAEFYQIPQTIYVGDRGRLVLPLGPEFTGAELSGALPLAEDLTVSRAAVERQGGKALLVLDFQAYRPGTLEIPPFALGNHVIRGLRVEVSSVLDMPGETMTLSSAAGTLIAPGTLPLVYGVVAGGLALALCCVAGRRFVPGRFRRWLEDRRRRRLVRDMERRLQALERRLVEGFAATEAAGVFAGAFREFLGRFTGKPCSAMSPEEFAGIPLPGSASLADLFRRCDLLRFSGEAVAPGQVLSLTAECRGFLRAVF